MPVRRARLRTFLVVLAIGFAFPLGALAAHQFADVPDSNPFHADIDALVDAGITSGCGGSNYCPRDLVTREQMAAFLNRLGALGPGKTPVVNADRLDGLSSGDFIQADSVKGDSYVCSAFDIFPTTSAVTWDTTTPGVRFPTSSGGGTFACTLHLPADSFITSAQWHVIDSSATSTVESCVLRRYETLTTGSSLLVLASAAATGAAATPGRVRLLDNSVSDNVVNNSAYQYVMSCDTTGSGSATGFLEFQVSYSYAIGIPPSN